MIEIQKLKAGFGRKEILHDICLSIPKNQITAIVGQSGCGKTTLLKSFNRILEEEGGWIQGAVLLEGEEVTKMDKQELRKTVGMVFQQPIALPFSVEKNLFYVLSYHKHLDKQELHRQTEYYLRKVRLYDEVNDKMKLFAERLSGGQKQRLAIARSLCVEPKVLLLDEPCSALDMKNTIAIEEMLMELKEQYSIVIVTHNLSQAKRIADQVVFMEQGRVLEATEKEQFFREPVSKEAKEQLAYM